MTDKTSLPRRQRTRLPRRNVMRAFKVDEISMVDKPCQAGAVAVLMKRDDGRHPQITEISLVERRGPAAPMTFDDDGNIYKGDHGDQEDDMGSILAKALDHSLHSIAEDDSLSAHEKSRLMAKSASDFMDAARAELSGDEGAILDQLYSKLAKVGRKVEAVTGQQGISVYGEDEDGNEYDSQHEDPRMEVTQDNADEFLEGDDAEKDGGYGDPSQDDQGTYDDPQEDDPSEPEPDDDPDDMDDGQGTSALARRYGQARATDAVMGDANLENRRLEQAMANPDPKDNTYSFTPRTKVGKRAWDLLLKDSSMSPRRALLMATAREASRVGGAVGYRTISKSVIDKSTGLSSTYSAERAGRGHYRPRGDDDNQFDRSPGYDGQATTQSRHGIDREYDKRRIDELVTMLRSKDRMLSGQAALRQVRASYPHLFRD